MGLRERLPIRILKSLAETNPPLQPVTNAVRPAWRSLPDIPEASLFQVPLQMLKSHPVQWQGGGHGPMKIIPLHPGFRVMSNGAPSPNCFCWVD